MFTANYYKMQALIALAPKKYGTQGALSIQRTNGSYDAFNSESDKMPQVLPQNYYSNTGNASVIRFGNGTKQEEINDYNINAYAQNTFGVSFGTAVITYDSTDNSYTNTVKMSILNQSTTNNYTITEYGLFFTDYMIYRELLSESITIGANETVNFEISVKFFMTNDVPNQTN